MKTKFSARGGGSRCGEPVAAGMIECLLSVLGAMLVGYVYLSICIKKKPRLQFISIVVQLHSRGQLLVTPWTAARLGSLSFTISWSLLKLVSMESVMPSNHLILCRPLLPLPSIFPSIRVFSNESALGIRRPKDRSFSLRVSASSAHSGPISFRMDPFDRYLVE